MLVTIKGTPKKPKVQYNFSVRQVDALLEPEFLNEVELIGTIGKQWKQVMKSLEEKELFRKVGKNGAAFTRTAWGSRVAEVVASRQ